MALVLAEVEQPRRMLCHPLCLDSKLAKISSNETQHDELFRLTKCGKESLNSA